MGADFYMNPPNRQAKVNLESICLELSEQFIKWWDDGKDPLKVYDLEDAVIDYRNAKHAYDRAK